MDLQHALRSILRGMPRLLLGGVPSERAGDDRLALHRLGVASGGGLALTSDAFRDGAEIPRRYTADGQGEPPPLRWSGVPQGAGGLALFVEDPDAPTVNPFVNWMLYGLPPRDGSTEEPHYAGALQGRNSLLKAGWAPCAPPKGDVAHRYVFQLFVLDRAPRLRPRSGRAAVLGALQGRVVGCAALIGTYQR
jgi:Raf kinase inhibitor-like YbhB/YbcL family protein